MKETREFDKTLEDINNNLTEKDAKSLLKTIYGFFNTTTTGEGDYQVKVEVVDKLSSIYNRIPHLIEIRQSITIE